MGLRLYELDDARLHLHQSNDSKIGGSEEVAFHAESHDFHSNETQTCQERFTVFFVKPDNLSIW